jgi:hypothetical protein
MSKKATSTTPGGPQTFDAIYPGTTQAVSYDSSTQTTNAVGSTTTVVQVTCTTAAFVAIGTDPTASTTNGAYVPAATPVKFAINPGDKVAALKVASAGTMYVTEGA